MNKVTQSAGWFAALLGLGVLSGACDRRENESLGRATERETYEARDRVRREAAEAERAAREATDNERLARERAAQTAAPATTSLAFNDALSSIAEARCDREQRCNNVGPGKRYESSQSCRANVRTEFADDLNPSECSAGIDRSELSECMQEIRNEDCNNPFDTLGRIAACRTSDMCRHVGGMGVVSP